MLTHPTIDQLRTLKLDGMADAFIELQAQDTARDLAHAEWLALLLDREAAKRDTSRFQSRLRSAKLRHSQASIEDVDYRAARRLDKIMFQQLATGRWIADFLIAPDERGQPGGQVADRRDDGPEWRELDGQAVDVHLPQALRGLEVPQTMFAQVAPPSGDRPIRP